MLQPESPDPDASLSAVHAGLNAQPITVGGHRWTQGAAVTPALAWTALVAASFVVYLLCNRTYNAGRGDFFYLADAFLHGRTWLPAPLGAWDNVIVGASVFVPFGPFPAIMLLPLVALVGPQAADSWQPIVNAGIAALDVGLAWILVARLGVARLPHRLALAVLFGFSTQIWWVTTRGGVWHTGHLVASALTLLVLIELLGRRRLLLVGLLGGAAFLTRAPLLFALPLYGAWALLETPRPGVPAAFVRPRRVAGSAGAALRDLPVREWFLLTLGVVPSLLFSFWYNAVRFGSALESGYGMASLPAFLEAQRRIGLFSVLHLGRNLDYLLWHLPRLIPNFPFFRPDGLGLSILIASPGLFLAVRAPAYDRRAWLLAGLVGFTLMPNLLYYGGGWLQFGYRYALDAIPFALALCAMAVASRGRIVRTWLALILAGVVVNAAGAYWANHV